MKGYITPKELAVQYGIQYYIVLALLRSGAIPGKKEKGKWIINHTKFKQFQENNSRRIARLKKEYIKLYNSGLNHEVLQRRVMADFGKHHIIAQPYGFAEKTICDYLRGDKNGRKIRRKNKRIK